MGKGVGLWLSLMARGGGAAHSPTRYPDAVPSYRVTATIGALRPGTNPESVLPTAADAGRERTTVEAWDLAIVRGEARITIRFVADDDDGAFPIADHICAVTGGIAEIVGHKVTRRYGGRWYPIRPGGPRPSLRSRLS